MNTNEHELLKEGVKILCEGDESVNALITPREDEIISLLNRYINEIEEYNKIHSLVKVSGTKELITRHILDSLAPMKIICSLLPAPCYLKIADIGSGAGLPGIPLAIVLPDRQFTLIERMKRRADFLRNTINVLGLSNVNIEEKDLKEISHKMNKDDQNEKSKFDLITFRAFSPLEPKTIKQMLKICKKTGIIASYKGKRQKIDTEIEVIKPIIHDYEVIKYDAPFLKEEERHIVLIRN